MNNDKNELALNISAINSKFLHFLEAMRLDPGKYPVNLTEELLFAFDAAEGAADSSTSRSYH